MRGLGSLRHGGLDPLACSRKRRLFSWMGSALLFNAALGPIGTFVQLRILELHGTVVDVSLAAALYGLTNALSVMLWGFVVDRFHRRRPMIVASFLSTSLILLLFLAAGTVRSVILLYALIPLVASMSTTPLNLLILETEGKSRWAAALASFSLLTSAGQTLGLLLGIVWPLLLPLRYFAALLSIASFTSACLAYSLVKEPLITFERRVIVMYRPSFLARLRGAPYMFIRAPSLADFKRVFRMLRCRLTAFTPTLYLSSFLFYVASGLFNTSFIPSLKARGLCNLAAFLTTSTSMAAQTLSFEYAGRYVRSLGPLRGATFSLLLRAACYSLIGVAVYAAYGLPLLALILVPYVLAAGLAYALYYTSSSVAVFYSINHHQGSHLGVYSALVGFATVAGSLASGLISSSLGFHATFMAAAACLTCSALLMWWLAKIYH